MIFTSLFTLPIVMLLESFKYYFTDTTERGGPVAILSSSGPLVTHLQ